MTQAVKSEADPCNLNEDNLLIYAIKCYEKPSYVMSEFEEDFKRIQYLQKLFSRYMHKGELKERLILNHLIVLYNVFGAEPTARMLFFQINPEYYTILKTFLIYLNIMPARVEGINGKTILSSDVQIDLQVANKLREI